MKEEDLKNFEDTLFADLSTENSDHSVLDTKPAKYENQPERLFEEKIKEQQQRSAFRNKMYSNFFGLLIAQHIGMAALSVIFVISGNAAILTVIVPATLLETYGVLKVMVQYVFSPGDFEIKKQ